MKRITLLAISALSAAFGLLTIVVSSSVIFDLFNMREIQGHYVPFVVWANFFSGILFVVAGAAFFKEKKWSPRPLFVSLAILGVAVVGLVIHINSGGAYELKTVAAITLRIVINGALALIVYTSVKKHQTSRFSNARLVSVLPLILLAASCNQRHDAAHDHHTEVSHHHEGIEGPLMLNNGVKWEADAHTLSVVADMKSELTDFENGSDADHHVLANSLTRQLNVLIAGCTMEGAAHDELHKWLVPVTKSISDLAAAQDAADAHAEINSIESSLNEFDMFFEGKE